MVKTIIRSLCLFLFISLSVSAYDRSTDSLALIALYDATNGDNWTNTIANNKPWKVGSIDNWFGVTILNNRVFGLNLARNGLSGNLPTDIGNFTYVYNIYIYDNPNLTGNIPNSISNCASLQRLWLHNNGMSGQLPNEIGSIPNIKMLWLYGNNFNGTIPLSLGNTDLTHLNLGSNNLSGSIPNEIGNLNTLIELNVRRNNLDNIGHDIIYMLNLTTCDLGYNKLCCLSSAVKQWANTYDPDWESTQDCDIIPDDCGLIGHWEFYSDCNDCYNTAKDTAYDLTGNGHHLHQDLAGTALITDTGFTNKPTETNPVAYYKQVWTTGMNYQPFIEFDYDYSYYVKFYNDSVSNSSGDAHPLIWRDINRGIHLSNYTWDDPGHMRFTDGVEMSTRVLTEDRLTNGWHSVAAIREGDTVKIYLDGVLDSAKYLANQYHTNDDYFSVGGRGAFNSVFFGTVAETRYYQRALSASDVSSLHASSFPSGGGRSSKLPKVNVPGASFTSNFTLPKEFCVSQNTPNPFKNSTSINFSLPVSNSGEVNGYKTSIKIFDLRGRLVKELLNNELKSGVHNIIWDGMDSKNRSVKSGTYICKIEAGSYVKSIKMSLGK